MARITAQQAGGARVLAVLDTIRRSEGTSTNPLTRDDGYDVIVTGYGNVLEVFTDYSDHPFHVGYPDHMRPSKVIRKDPKTGKVTLTSNASGGYQFMLKDWPHYRDQLHLPDFSPVSQDLWAVQLIKETGAIPLINSGAITSAIMKFGHLWASMDPQNQYGQNPHKMAVLVAMYNEFAAGIV